MSSSSEEGGLLQSKESYGATDDNTTTTFVHIDDVFKKIGNYGRFQLLIQLLTTYLVLTIGYHFVLAFFIGNDPSWKCISNNSSVFCRINHGRHISSDSDEFNERCKLSRGEWKYTTSKRFSFVTEFDLVCGETAIAALASSSFYMGGLAGSIVSGTLADACGRKIVILSSLLITICSSIGCAYVTSILQLTVIRSILGAAHVACYFTAFVYLSEFIIPIWRASATNVYIMSLTLSQMLIDLLAYAERDWRRIQLLSSFPCILAFVLFIFVPESPRWLLAKRKYVRAKYILEKIAKLNGKSSLGIHLVPPSASNETLYSYIDLFRSWKVLSLTLSLGMLWLSVPLIYYTIAMESSSLGGDMYEAFVLLALSDVPTYFLSAYTCNRFGRKASNLISLFIAGILIGSIALIPKSLPVRYTVNLVVVILGKFFIEMAFNGMYTWTMELYPTVLRSQGLSVCVIFERVGLLMVPFLTSILQRRSYNSPFLFVCGLAIVSCAVSMKLPETNKQATRECYEDFFQEPTESPTRESSNISVNVSSIREGETEI